MELQLITLELSLLNETLTAEQLLGLFFNPDFKTPVPGFESEAHKIIAEFETEDGIFLSNADDLILECVERQVETPRYAANQVHLTRIEDEYVVSVALLEA